VVTNSIVCDYVFSIVPLEKFRSYPKKNTKPLAADYRAEIERRWKIIEKELPSFSSSPVLAPRPAQWTIPRLCAWLEDHPITCADDITFLRNTVSTRKEVLQQAILAQQEERLPGEEDILVSERRGNWTGKTPHLRLIHCLVDHDNIKKAFSRRNDLPSGRLHLDNPNSVDKRPVTVWELLSNKWNDPEYIVETECICLIYILTLQVMN
jgi:hypothetical protein